MRKALGALIIALFGISVSLPVGAFAQEKPTIDLSGSITLATSMDGTSASVRPWQVRQKAAGKDAYREAFVTFTPPVGSQENATLEISRYRCMRGTIEDLVEVELTSDVPVNETVFDPYRVREVAGLDEFRRKVFTAVCGMVLGAK